MGYRGTENNPEPRFQGLTHPTTTAAFCPVTRIFTTEDTEDHRGKKGDDHLFSVFSAPAPVPSVLDPDDAGTEANQRLSSGAVTQLSPPE